MTWSKTIVNRARSQQVKQTQPSTFRTPIWRKDSTTCGRPLFSPQKIRSHWSTTTRSSTDYTHSSRTTAPLQPRGTVIRPEEPSLTLKYSRKDRIGLGRLRFHRSQLPRRHDPTLRSRTMLFFQISRRWALYSNLQSRCHTNLRSCPVTRLQGHQASPRSCSTWASGRQASSTTQIHWSRGNQSEGPRLALAANYRFC